MLLEIRFGFIGDLLLKILNDTLRKLIGDSMKKFYLYSGHDVTLIQALATLGFDTIPGHVPDYGACLILEVHKIRKEYVLRVRFKTFLYSINPF